MGDTIASKSNSAVMKSGISSKLLHKSRRGTLVHKTRTSIETNGLSAIEELWNIDSLVAIKQDETNQKLE